MRSSRFKIRTLAAVGGAIAVVAAAAAMTTPAMQPAAASLRFLNLDELMYEPPRR